MAFLYILLLIRVILRVLRPLSYALFDFIGKIVFGDKEMLSPICSKILLMSATELADHIRKKKLTAVDVIQSYINRVKEVNPAINACVDERFRDALADAQAVDVLIESEKLTQEQFAAELPLLGVPFTCKEVIGVKGLAQTNGLLMFKDRKAPSNAEAVMEYRKAGAIPFVVTNVPTMSMMWETSNLVFGRTFNPYDKRRTCGGSSGGEAAILAAAGAIIGIGTDCGGSIRIPSAFCGIYAHKPTRGIVSNKQSWPDSEKNYDPFTSTGPMCRYVQDLKTLTRVLSGSDAEKLNLDDKVDFTKVSIYYMEELPGFMLSATTDIKIAVRKAVNHFQEKFSVTPVKLDLKEMQHAFEMVDSKFIEAGGQPITCLQNDLKVNWYWEMLKSIFKCSQFDVPFICCALTEKTDKDKNYYKYLKLYEILKSKLEDVLSGEAILLLPTHPEPAHHIFLTIPKFPNFGYTSIFNCLGYPATNIPAGMSSGIPIGLQAVAIQYKDRLTLAAAEELDKFFHGWNSPCEIKL